MRNGMTPLFDQKSLERWFEQFQSKAEYKTLVLLQAGGEKFIEVARRSGSYKDQTGNLRSSIGYIIAKDGEVVKENFKESDKGTDKTTGKYKGRRLAEEVSLSHTGGYILVGVAGMEYAAAVEAKGYEVISGANTQCEKYLRDTLKSVFSKI
ncbi:MULTISPECIES: hypothetical protein [Bacteroides]|mgnify:FL=1|jgi:hypothetical protein|uniref:hypothetical protein n=2 Tax=Bacteroides TaxID=816 RepID=UPI00164BABE5|nr:MULTISPECIES: hypothetical protein [Bacteroides]MBC5586145.1 hypothetical protein [Bacteroides sp. NSJ-39]DAZ69526.1 MAG TPA: hypothetical protein [Caudoviricetes sp.]